MKTVHNATTKIPFKALFATIPLLFAIILSFIANPAGAQTFTVLYAFTNGTDGNLPLNGLILAPNGTLYGTTYNTDWAVNTNGTDFTVLTNQGQYEGLNGDGESLAAPLLYKWYADQLYSLNTNGSGLTQISFPSYVTDIDDFTLVGNTIYGLCNSTNSGSGGAVFSASTNGSNFTYLYNFTTNDGILEPYSTPGHVIVAGGRIYISTTVATSAVGGSDFGGKGSIFSVDTNGQNYNLIYMFTNITTPDGCGDYGPYPYIYVFTNNTLYGVWQGDFCGSGPNNPINSGAVFAVSANGTFTNGYITNGYYTNIYEFNGYDGSRPQTLILSGDTLYGTAYYGFGDGFNPDTGGVIFSVKTNGCDYQVLFNMPESTNGENPDGPIILSGNTIYGVNEEGGSGGWGLIYSFTLPGAPILSIAVAPTNQVVLTWETNYPNYQLQFATNLNPPVVWSDVTNEPVVVSNLFEVTNAICFGTTNMPAVIQEGARPMDDPTNGIPIPPGGGGTNGVIGTAWGTYFRLMATNNCMCQ